MIVAERNIDLFAGPGGWDEGAAGLDIRPLGIEWDAAACATRRARGHETLQADVSQLDPVKFAPVRLMIASAPCQAFSMAGTGHARKALEAYVAEIRSMMAGNPINRERLDRACSDERGHLVLEPLRWALAIRPRFIACENVEPVLPLWEAMASALRELGYGTWAGVLSSECYGVPQTRRRAFLLAKLDGEVTPPPATHQRYIAPRVKAKQEESLFDAPEPERIVAPEDRELLPWVSMAEALGGMVCVVSEKARSAIRMRSNAQPKAAVRSADEPAATIKGGHDTADRVWVTEDPPTHYDSRGQRDGRTRELNRQRRVDEPAPTIAGESRNDSWVNDRPATTVAGDPRVFPPGHKINQGDIDAGRGGQQRSGAGYIGKNGEPIDWSQRPATTIVSGENRSTGELPNGAGAGAVRVTVEEAAVLQGFPPDYPWQGTRTAQYRQIGDAVPPPWARAILAHLLAS